MSNQPNTLEELLEERGNNYGNFQTQANLCQMLVGTIYQHYAQTHTNERLPTYIAEAIHMVCHKLARIANGDPMYEDSWQDIAGYSQLVVDILKGQNTNKPEGTE